MPSLLTRPGRQRHDNGSRARNIIGDRPDGGERQVRAAHSHLMRFCMSHIDGGRFRIARDQLAVQLCMFADAAAAEAHPPAEPLLATAKADIVDMWDEADALVTQAYPGPATQPVTAPIDEIAQLMATFAAERIRQREIPSENETPFEEILLEPGTRPF